MGAPRGSVPPLSDNGGTSEVAKLVKAIVGSAQFARPRIWHRVNRNWVAYVYIAPFYILFCVFGGFPIVFSLLLSFSEWRGTGSLRWVGFSNYQRLAGDRLFVLSLKNTLLIGLGAHLPMLLAALGLALLVNSPLVPYKELFRTAYFMPIVTSAVAVSLVFSILYGHRYGLINWLLGRIGLGPINWFGGRGEWIKPAIIVLLVWRWVGWNMVIYLAGLQSISPELSEAAALDGANLAREFWHIRIPLLRPVILFTAVMSAIGTMSLFDEPFILIGGMSASDARMGGTSNAGLTVAMYIYNRAFNVADFGYASSMAYVVSAFIVLASALAYRLLGQSRDVA